MSFAPCIQLASEGSDVAALYTLAPRMGDKRGTTRVPTGTEHTL